MSKQTVLKTLAIALCAFIFSYSAKSQKLSYYFDHISLISNYYSSWQGDELRVGIALSATQDGWLFNNIKPSGPFIDVGYAFYNTDLISTGFGVDFTDLWLGYDKEAISINRYSDGDRQQYVMNLEVGIDVLRIFSILYSRKINLSRKMFFL